MTISRPSSLVLSDWGAYGETYRSRNKLVNDLILLSLLYDHVLIQDEVFVLSDNLPKWFDGIDGRELLHKIFRLDSIALLAWPLSAYTKNIGTDPEQHPIEARAEWHVKNSTRGDQLFLPNERHRRFYKQLEASLSTRKTSSRERGSISNLNVGDSFRTILSEVLSKDVYKPWLKCQYRPLSHKIIDNILRYIDAPDLAVRDLNDNGYRVNVVIDGDTPVFNRSLGFQVSKMYRANERKALQDLIQSVYAIPLCECEKAVGRYSGQLREVPWNVSNDYVFSRTSNAVRVEAEVDTELCLPSIMDDFPAIINRVRKSTEGKALRKAFRNIGNESDFVTASKCWSDVSGVLATNTKKANTHKARTTAISIGTKVVFGTVVGGFLQVAAPLLDPYLSGAIGGLVSEGVGVYFDHALEVMNNDLSNGQMRSELERAVKIRCTWIPYKI